MESFLKEMYHRGFGIKNNSRTVSKEEQKLFRIAEEDKEKLKSTLNEEQIKQFEKFMVSYGNFRYASECNEFISGFRLGSRIIMEIFFGDASFELSD